MRGGRGESGGQPPSVSFFPPGKRFTGLRHELPWLSEYSFTITGYTLDHQAEASRRDRNCTCVACSHADHAELNAARNILASGIGAAAWRGAPAPVTSKSHEIDRGLTA